MANNRPQDSRSVSLFGQYAVQQKSPFDISKLENKLKYKQTDWSIPEAYLGLLLAAAMADGQWRPEEEDKIREYSMRSRALSSFSVDDLAAIERVVTERIAQRPNSALQECCETLPADMCLPVFAHCVDIILSDGELETSESQWLNNLVPMLDVDPDHARRVMEVLLLKASY